jgi:hypothetical protein
MGTALLVAATLMLITQLQAMTGRQILPLGGTALGVSGGLLIVAVVGNFLLGALMTLGIGLYAPCMILISLLGMNPTTAFPIMMGSCAFLMPVGSLRFIRERAYSLPSALGLALGGIPGVLIAAYIVKSLNLGTVHWLVIVVVLYTAVDAAVGVSEKARPRRTSRPDFVAGHFDLVTRVRRAQRLRPAVLAPAARFDRLRHLRKGEMFLVGVRHGKPGPKRRPQAPSGGTSVVNGNTADSTPSTVCSSPGGAQHYRLTVDASGAIAAGRSADRRCGEDLRGSVGETTFGATPPLIRPTV